MSKSKVTAVLDRSSTNGLTFELAKEQDAADMWELVRDSGVLDVNSQYSYLMMCKFYSETCLVAKNSNGEVVGFVTAFRPPEKQDVVFVWQIGVSPIHRKEGIGSRILKALLETEACEDVRYLEATISPSNTASQRLFTKLAVQLDTQCTVDECFPKDLFHDEGDHESEHLYRIGPLK